MWSRAFTTPIPCAVTTGNTAPNSAPDDLLQLVHDPMYVASVKRAPDDLLGRLSLKYGLGTGDVMMSTLLSTVLISALLNVVAVPFFSAMLIATYWDLKLRKEGGDLAARVGALNAA